MNEQQGEALLYRHADKGKWTVNEDELRAHLREDEANLVLEVLKKDFSQMTETPLKFDGLIRSLRLAEQIYADLPQKSVLVATDSGKDRAQLTRALVVARISQLEAKDRKLNGDDKAKRVDMLLADTKDITTKLADSHPDTWAPYQHMMDEIGISESEALARWINDMNNPKFQIPPDQHPKESSKRYRDVILDLRKMVTSEQVPVVILGAGHSGPFAQVRYDDLGRPTTADDSPKFCETFIFDNAGKFVESRRVET